MNELAEQNNDDGLQSQNAEQDIVKQQQLVEMAWNQQDPRKIADDLNALIKNTFMKNTES